jgi:hypothetical protein
MANGGPAQGRPEARPAFGIAAAVVLPVYCPLISGADNGRHYSVQAFQFERGFR